MGCSHPACSGAERQPEARPPTPPCSSETGEAGRLASFLRLTCLCIWSCWVVLAERAFLWLWCAGPLSSPTGFSRCGSRALRARASAGVAHGLSCLSARGIFQRQGSEPRLLHRQADSLPPSHQGSSPTPHFIPFCPPHPMRSVQALRVYFVNALRAPLPAPPVSWSL